MSIRVSRRDALRTSVAAVGLFAATAALSGCTSSVGRATGDPAYTSSISRAGESNLNQPMPTLQPASTQVAVGPYIPPADVGGDGFVSNTPMPTASVGRSQTVMSNDLPALTSNGTPAMPAQANLAPVTVAPRTSSLDSALPVNSAQPTLAAVPQSQPLSSNQSAYRHTITSGESLYTIARRYDVTAQAIVEANGFDSPNKIYVGQQIIIPGRPEVLAAKAGTPMVGDQPTASPLPAPAPQQVNTAAIENPSALQGHAPVIDAPVVDAPVVNAAPKAPNAAQVAATQQPAMSSAGKFRWPVSGKVIVDFASSKGTGINIEAPEGTQIRAAENGTVIYVGSGVEGYGNLVLIRHANGYVSAYAHLKATTVQKGATVTRGDSIGTIGMTGSVTRPQLHFELRMGATPVDPVPLLAG